MTLPTTTAVTTNATGAAKRTYHTGVHYGGDSVCLCVCERVDKPRRVQEECGGNNIGAHPVAYIITITSNRLVRPTPKYTLYYNIILYTATLYLPTAQPIRHERAERPTTTHDDNIIIASLFLKRDSSQSIDKKLRVEKS